MPERHIGDPLQRVSVPLPRSLPELQLAAERQFGFGGNGHLKMYHQGITPLRHPTHVKHLQDDDLVVIACEGQHDEVDKFDGTSTYRAEFVPHQSEPMKAPPQRDAAAMPSGRFEGESRYRMDFVRHSATPRGIIKKEISALCSEKDKPTGDSTYNVEFPWHDIPARYQRPGMVGNGASSGRFVGESSYHRDYVKHDGVERPKTAAAAPSKRWSELPFEGSSTYKADFQKTECPERPMSCRPSDEDNALGAPFQGNSEYRDRYLEWLLQRQMRIHLEPELLSQPSAATRRPASASAPVGRPHGRDAGSIKGRYY